jgi:ABC-type glycerol-3-phosphate transport system substrate-binding protein
MKKTLLALAAVLMALGATACSTDGGAAAARVTQQMNTQGGPN